MTCLRDISPAIVESRLRGAGLVLDLGAMTVRVKSCLPDLAQALKTVYSFFPFLEQEPFVDSVVEIRPIGGLRRWIHPGVRFLADGIEPFGPLPRSMTLPQLEWGINWCFANMFNQHLLLHAGAVELDSVGVLLIGQPGAGKSTLTAALGLRNLRVLSDEFGVICLDTGELLPFPKPVSLKNQSIPLIRSWAPDAILGPIYHKTHKGDVAHLALSELSASGRRTPAVPRLVVFPEWSGGADPSVESVTGAAAFSSIAFNSFNYDTLGPDGYDAVARLVDSCRCVRLRYGRLKDAERVLRSLVASLDGVE